MILRRALNKIAETLFVFFIGIFLAALVGEAAVRIFLDIPERPIVFVHEQNENLKLLYRPVPGSANNAYGVFNRINRDGFRDREYAIEKSPGVCRIVCLGDSVVYGYGLELEQTLPKQLEKKFVAHDRRVEVLNLGVSGYETEQEIEFLKMVGLKYKPDYVMVGYTLNDSNYGSWELDLFHSKFELDVADSMAGKNPYQRFLNLLYQYSKLLTFLDRKLHLQRRIKILSSYGSQPVSLYHYIEQKNKRNKDPENSSYRQLEHQIVADAERLGVPQGTLKFLMGNIGFWTDDFHSSHWNISKRAFLELKTLAEQHHFKVIVVIFPFLTELNQYPLTSLHQYLRREFLYMGFEIIDLLSFAETTYREKGAQALTKDTIHFNREGAMLAAKFLYDELLQSGFCVDSSNRMG